MMKPSLSQRRIHELESIHSFQNPFSRLSLFHKIAGFLGTISVCLNLAWAQAPDSIELPEVPEDITARFESEAERNGYVLGNMIAEDMVNRVRRLGYDGANEAIAKGFTDWVMDRSSLTKPEIQQVFARMQAEVRRAEAEQRMKAGMKNQSEADSFFAKNAKEEGVTKLESGLQYKVLEMGKGEVPSANDTVIVHYRGTLLDGTEFDSSYSRGQPARFAVNKVIKGWTEALQLMPIGSKWQLFVPQQLAYGETGSPPRIGPFAALVFEIELLGVAGKPVGSAGGQPVVTSDIIKVPSKAELEQGAKIEVIKAEDLEKLKQEAQDRKSQAEGDKE